MSNTLGLPEYENYFEERGWDEPSNTANYWYADQVQRKSGFADKSRVLEIGFGSAGFLDWCKDRGHIATGVEILEASLRKARALGHEVFAGPFNSSSLPPERLFDVIAAFDVLEHLTFEEIRHLLQDTLPHMAPDGRYVFRFPNGNSPFVGPIQSGDITPPLNHQPQHPQGHW